MKRRKVRQRDSSTPTEKPHAVLEPRRGHRSSRLIATIILVAATTASIVQGVGLRQRVLELDRDAESLGRTLSDRISQALLADMDRVEAITEEFARALERGEIGPETLDARMEEASRAEPYLLGLTVAYEPFAFNGERRLYAPFFSVESGDIVPIEDYYDYTDAERREDALWYQQANRDGPGVWVSGYGPAAGTTYVGYSVPFFRDDSETEKRVQLGVVNMSVSLEDFNDLLNKQIIGRLGGGILINAEGLLLANPRFDVVRAGVTLVEVARERNNRELGRLAERMMAGATGEARLRVEVGGATQDGWFFYRPIERAGWSLLVGLFENELMQAGDELRRRKIVLVLNALVVLILAAALVLRVDRLDEPRLWALSAIASLLLVGAIGLVWRFAGEAPPRQSGLENDSRRVGDLQGLDAFLDEQLLRAERLHLPEPTVIPTTIFVRSLTFQDASHVQIGGTIWQRYSTREHDDLTRAVSFPGIAPEPEALDLTETGRELVGDAEVVTWDFRVLLRERFDYGNYPFDHQRVPIKLGHPDRARNVILIPDLRRYQLVNSAARPGVFNDLVLPGWTVRGSDFSYEPTDYEVRFGDGPASLTEVPVLQFNILTRREILTPFISHIAPLLIVAALLHGVLISSSFNEEKKSSSGFSTFGVLETSGAFFFTIALMHIDLRRGLGLDTITYLEALYITSYFVLLLVVINSLLFTTTDAVPLLEYRDNLAAKLLFWPITLGIILFVTVFTFI